MVSTPATGPTSHSAARSTSPVVCTAPATQPSTRPHRTRASATRRGDRACAAACASVIPFGPRRASSSAATWSMSPPAVGSITSQPGMEARGAPMSTGSTTFASARARAASSVRGSSVSGRAIRRRCVAARLRIVSTKLTARRSSTGAPRRREDAPGRRPRRRSARPRAPDSR